VVAELVGAFVSLILLGVSFRALEAVFPAVVQPRLWRRGTNTDLAYFLLITFITGPAVKVVLFLFVVGWMVWAGVPLREGSFDAWRESHGLLAHVSLWIQVPLVLFLGDLIGYALHRAAHLSVLWRFHSIHHSSKELDWLSSVRVHPIDTLLNRLSHAALLVPLGFDLRAVAAYTPLLTLYAVFLHANVPWSYGPLRFVIASPAFHRWHHTAEAQGLNKNFAGLFSFIDLIFGSFYLPRRQPTAFGTCPDDRVPDRIGAQLVHPFRA